MNRLILSTVAFFFLFLQENLYAEENYAILHTSPELRKGIPELGPNVIENYFATYRVGKLKFNVRYTEYKILPFKEWRRYNCKKIELYLLPSSDEYLSTIYLDKKGYTLIFQLPKNWQYSCVFISNFLTEFKFFMAFRKYESDVPFPAVVKLE